MHSPIESCVDSEILSAFRCSLSIDSEIHIFPVSGLNDIRWRSNGEPIIFLVDCDAHLAESLFQTCSRNFTLYIGFTEAEVKTLTEKYNQDYEKKITGGTNHGTFLFHPTRADRVEC